MNVQPLVVPHDADELADVSAKLAPFDVEPYPNHCIPEDMRDQVYMFVSSAGISFEQDNVDATEPILPPKALSSHGQPTGSSQPES